MLSLAMAMTIASESGLRCLSASVLRLGAMPAQDPEERFDLCDRDGRPLGASKPCAQVHRDGDWHRSVHIWVVLAGEPEPTAPFEIG